MTSARIVCYSITIHVLNKPVFFLKCFKEATHGVLFLTLFFLLLTREVVSASSTRSLRRTTSSSCTNTRVTAWPAVEPVGEHVYKTLFSYFVRSSHKPVRRLPFKTDMVGNMQIFAYLWPYLFRIIHIIWTTWGCVHTVSFHGPLQSEIESRHHLPVVLRIHNLPSGTCISRTAGRLGPIFTY